jgi:hypothetical protein
MHRQRVLVRQARLVPVWYWFHYLRANCPSGTGTGIGNIPYLVVIEVLTTRADPPHEPLTCERC